MKCRWTITTIIGCALSQPSGTYEFYNSNTDSIVISVSAKRKYFNRRESSNTDSVIGKIFEKYDSDEHEINGSDSEDEFETKQNGLT